MLRSTAYDLPDALDVNELYQQKGWTDGLPIVPPTEERVVECCRRQVCRRGHSGRRAHTAASHHWQRKLPLMPSWPVPASLYARHRAILRTHVQEPFNMHGSTASTGAVRRLVVNGPYARPLA